MKEPVCSNCHQACDVYQVDNSPWNAQGGQTCTVGSAAVSFCCRAGLELPTNTTEGVPTLNKHPNLEGTPRSFVARVIMVVAGITLATAAFVVLGWLAGF